MYLKHEQEFSAFQPPPPTSLFSYLITGLSTGYNSNE